MIEKLIGNTPLIEIKCKYKNKIKKIYAKLEYYNYTGSIKDRMAFYIIKKEKERGNLKEGQPIVETTSGNTGISLSAIGAYYHHPVHIFMPDWASVERIKIMKLYGAKVYLISKEEGGFKEAIRRSKKLAKEINGFLPNQFSNPLNLEAHYKTTAEEIIAKIPKLDAFVSGIGTGGTLMGISKRLKEYYPNLKTIALEPSSMPLISKNKIIGNHKIEGIGDDFIPDLVDKKAIDKVILIEDKEAINMSRLLATTFGLGVGISSGANFLASVLTEEENVATVFADDFKKYLTTDLTLEENNNNNNLISNQIELLEMRLM